MKIYIDADVFVSNIIGEESNHKGSKLFIKYILDNNFPKDVSFLTSRFTGVEIASAIFRRTNNEEKARATLYKLERPWKEKIDLLPIKPKTKVRIDDLVIKLVETALRYGTKFGDTIHANDIESYEIDFLVTWNLKDFEKLKRNIDRLDVLTPKQMLDKLKVIVNE